MDIDDSLHALKQQTEGYRKTQEAHEASRAATIQAVLDALRAGVGPTKVAAASPFTATWVRALARENGIAPAKK